MARILLAGEATWHKTGYANYGKNILTLLKKRGHEVAEISAFGYSNDDRHKECDWKIYFCDPDENNEEEKAAFENSLASAIGGWKLEFAALDFLPDYVISFRDPWVDRYIGESPLKKYFNWIFMPTCDAIPLDSNWIESFKQADAVLTYSNWALEEIKKYNHINLIKSAPPAAEGRIFFPMDEGLGKKSFGLPQDTFVFGTVMRNQERKLFPGLFQTFRTFLDRLPIKKRKKVKMVCHTSYPDVGWDIPRILIENNIENYVYFTNMCMECKCTFLTKWNSTFKMCPKCGGQNVVFPGPSSGFSRERLSFLYNAMDFYIQYAGLEGFGMPMVEASYCGIPVAATDYSAMSSVVREIDGFPIKVSGFYTESNSHRKIAVPDGEHLIKIMTDYMNTTEDVKNSKRVAVHQAAIKNFDYEKSCQVWEDAINSVPAKNNWFSSPEPLLNGGSQTAKTNAEITSSNYKKMNIDDMDFDWQKIYGIKSLNCGLFDKNSLGVTVQNQRFISFKDDDMQGMIGAKIQNIIFWENKRIKMIKSRKTK